MTSIDPSDPNLLFSSATGSSANSRPTTGSKTLDEDAFLKILIAQLENQDPTNPMDDSQFIAQMAQFSSLEQMTNMGNEIKSLVKAQQQNRQISLTQYIGKEVSWNQTTAADDGTKTTTSGTGVITGVIFGDDNSVTFTLTDGTQVGATDITAIKSGIDSSSALIQASYLIGKNVTYTNGGGVEGSAAVSAASMHGGSAVLTLDNGEKISTDQILKIAG